MDKLRKALSGDDGDEERGNIVLTQITDKSSLSYSTRIKGFIACFGIGFLLTILGSISVFFGNFVLFGILYSLGSVTAICSSFFLMGPINQLKKMFASTRLIATIIMLIALLMTLVAAFVWANGVLVLLFVIIQFLAMTWYSLSYIPFARDAVKKCFEGAVS